MDEKTKELINDFMNWTYANMGGALSIFIDIAQTHATFCAIRRCDQKKLSVTLYGQATMESDYDNFMVLLQEINQQPKEPL